MRETVVRWSPELAARVCAGWAAGKSVQGMCHEAGMPCRAAVFKWLRTRADFQAMWAAAGAERAALFARRPDLARAALGHAGGVSTYSARTAAVICGRIAAGASLFSLTDAPDLPSSRTIYKWLRTQEPFARMYRAACARRDGLQDEQRDEHRDELGDELRDELGRRETSCAGG